MARLIAEKLTSQVGQVIVENRPGGGGTVGFKAAANADPDGYTLLYNGLMALSVIPALSKSFEQEAAKGFVPVALVSSVPFVLIVAPRVPATTVQELVAYAKANPGKLNFGAPIGATPQLVGEMFKRKAGIAFVTIPYKGAANTMTDFLRRRWIAGSSPAMTKCQLTVRTRTAWSRWAGFSSQAISPASLCRPRRCRTRSRCIACRSRNRSWAARRSPRRH
jgi:tripartite-type tricarboxylate transporter receptor subunit TctC